MARKRRGTDYDISPFTVSGHGQTPDRHMADCTCGWTAMSGEYESLMALVIAHRAEHQAKGDSVEVV